MTKMPPYFVRPLAMVAIMLLAGCKPEELAPFTGSDQNTPGEVTTEIATLKSGEQVVVQVQRPAQSAADDLNTPLHLLTQMVIEDPLANDLQLSERVDPKTGHCVGRNVFSFSGPDHMLWIDVSVLRKNHGGGPMVRGDFLLLDSTLKVLNARVVDAFGVPQRSLPDRDFHLQKGVVGSVRIDGLLVWPCKFTVRDAAG